MRSSSAIRPLTIAASDIVVNEITLVGSRCGPFDRAIESLTRDPEGIGEMIVARYPLEEALTAIDHAARRGTLKVLLEME